MPNGKTFLWCKIQLGKARNAKRDKTFLPEIQDSAFLHSVCLCFLGKNLAKPKHKAVRGRIPNGGLACSKACQTLTQGRMRQALVASLSDACSFFFRMLQLGIGQSPQTLPFYIPVFLLKYSHPPLSWPPGDLNAALERMCQKVKWGKADFYGHTIIVHYDLYWYSLLNMPVLMTKSDCWKLSLVQAFFSDDPLINFTRARLPGVSRVSTWISLVMIIHLWHQLYKSSV